MKIKSALLVSSIALAATLPVHATPLLHDSFSGPTGAIPAGWTHVGLSTTINDYVTTGSLSIDGLAPSSGGKWSFDSSLNTLYRRDFSTTPIAVGETIYFSFILQVDDIGSLGGGHTQGLFYLNSADSTGAASGVAAIGISKDANDSTKFNLSIDGDFRGPGNANSVKLSTQFATGTPVFIVGSYTLNAASGSTATANFWINPNSYTFGAINEPSVTATDTGGNRTNIQSFFAGSGTGSSSQPSAWSIDELRFGTTWADVTPIPEPSSMALLGGASAMALVALRRRR